MLWILEIYRSSAMFALIDILEVHTLYTKCNSWFRKPFPAPLDISTRGVVENRYSGRSAGFTTTSFVKLRPALESSASAFSHSYRKTISLQKIGEKESYCKRIVIVAEQCGVVVITTRIQVRKWLIEQKEVLMTLGRPFVCRPCIWR